MEQGVDRAEIASVGRAEHDGRRTCATVPVVTEGDLLRQHADVLFDVDAHGRLVRLNEPGDGPPPRLFLARGRRTQRIWFRTDVPAATAEACRRIARGLPRWDGRPSSGAIYDGLRAVLAGDEPITEERCGPAYRFGEHVDLHVDAEVTVIDEGSAICSNLTSRTPARCWPRGVRSPGPWSMGGSLPPASRPAGDRPQPRPA